MIEYITNIPVEKLKPFPNHPFQVRDDDSMRETVESIKTYGVLQPAIVRPSDDGNYEILSGHRRKHACELAGRKTIPAIVRELDDDAAIIFMVDSNLQRENILPSERAAAVNTVPDAPTARHTAPHKNRGEPHQKSDTAHRNQLIQVAYRHANPRRHFSTAKSCAKRRLHACSTSFSLCQKCRRNLSHCASDYRLISFDLI